MTEYGKPLQAMPTTIPGLTMWRLSVHGDNRGWFKENWQRQKMVALGLPDFSPVQNNISFNRGAGTVRGIHAEPWDKLVSVAAGKIFGAWVDLRSGPNFGRVFTAVIDPALAVFVPRGVGNAFQTLEPNTAYTYLVNDHYSPNSRYTYLNLADDTIAIKWPIPLHKAEMSEKDRHHPTLQDVVPVNARKILIIGGTGQVGRALRRVYGDAPDVEFIERQDFDLASDQLYSARNWSDYNVIINAAAYTAVDLAETASGRATAWAVNVSGVAQLARIASRNNLLLVHISSDYVFDGRMGRPYLEDDPVSPLSVYGQTKAAADQIVSTVPRHYIVRTSWVIGDGNNFVRTMASLARKGVDPSVVNDQYGRLTFTPEIARAIRHLVESNALYGTYNVTGSGDTVSWFDIARDVFSMVEADPDRVFAVSTEEYSRMVDRPIAPRPVDSTLDLTRICQTGYVPSDVKESLANYARNL